MQKSRFTEDQIAPLPGRRMRSILPDCKQAQVPNSKPQG